MLGTAALLRQVEAPYAFVGDVALNAWLDRPHNGHTVDVVTLLGDRPTSLLAAAGEAGLTFDEREIARCEELDLIPLRFDGRSDSVRIHLLLATNALYGRMIQSAVEGEVEGTWVRVVSAEDLALLLSISGTEESARSLEELTTAPGVNFDHERFRRMLTMIGIAGARR